MAKQFAELEAKMSPDAKARSNALYHTLLAEMPLNELRRARGLSQRALADVLHVQQPSVAKMERRTDMYISSLRSHIEAMGGELEITARFPDGTVKITNFTGIDMDSQSTGVPPAGGCASDRLPV
jgi:predicted XRE-type DNA-binding protein